MKVDEESVKVEAMKALGISIEEEALKEVEIEVEE